MNRYPVHDEVEIVERLGFRRFRAPHHDDRYSERPSRLDLRVGRAAATVFGDERLDPLASHEVEFARKREGTTRQDQFVFGQSVDLRRGIDRPNDIAVLWGVGENRELKPPLGQQYDFAVCAERLDPRRYRRNLDPAIAGFQPPGRTGENDERDAGRAAGGGGVGRNARGERMGRVDDSCDLLPGEIGGQTLGAAEAAHSLWDRLRGGIGGGACERQDRRHPRFTGEAVREGARFARAAQDEQTKTRQRAAP